MTKIPIGWRALVATSNAVIVRFTGSRGPGEYLLYIDEGNYVDIRIHQVSSLVVVAESTECRCYDSQVTL
jgi:hypothetical protein